jgi:hypothetical protein
MRQSCFVLVPVFAFLVAACGGGGPAATPPAEAVILAAPGGVSLVPGTTSATLTWAPVESAQGYHAFLAASAGIPAQGSGGMAGAQDGLVPAAEQTFTFDGLVPGTRYYAIVCAMGADGASPPSDEVSTMLLPAPPVGVSVQGADQSLLVAWPVIPGETYDVFFAASPAVGSDTWGSLPRGASYPDASCPLTVPDLENGTTYYVVVRAHNEAGAGPDSAPVAGAPTARGSFLPAGPLGTGTLPTEVAAGDVDGDGLPDLAVCDGLDGTITFYRGDVDGLFAFGGALPIEEPLEIDPSQITDPPGRHPLALADYDGDGLLDLAVGLRPGQGLRVYLGDGAFGFTEGANLAFGAEVSDIVAGDLDGDGVPDLVATDVGSDTVQVWLGDGQGGFDAQDAYQVGSSPARAVLGDLDGDGHLDLLVSNASSDTLSVLMGDGAGGLQAGDDVATSAGPQGLALGDLDGDGHLDAAVAASGASVAQSFIGGGDGTFESGAPAQVGSDARDLALGDFGGDGVLDLVVSSRAAGTLTVFRGNGYGSFTWVQTLEMPADQPGRIAVADFDGDGVLDLAVVLSGMGGVGIFHGAR